MKEGLKLKIGEDWCVLNADTSISIDMTSPLWNDSGSFSYPFTIPYEANRHIFHAADMPASDVNLKTFRKNFELYVNDMGLLYGDVVCSDDYIDTESDSISLELRSGNATFDDSIDGKSLRDIDLGEEVGLGKLYTYIIWSGVFFDHTKLLEYKLHINENNIYPAALYCNIPVIANNEKSTSERKGIVMSARRIFSSPCMFALYVLKKIMQYNSYAFDEQNDCDLYHIEDFKRLVLINTKLEYKSVFGEFIGDGSYYDYIYATSEVLPDVEMSTFIESFENAFGMRIISDNRLQKNRIVLLRSVFRSKELLELNLSKVYSMRKKHLSFDGITMKYSTDEGDEYEYSDYKIVNQYDSYNKILEEFSATSAEKRESDNSLKISTDTGNFFRVKVDDSSFENAALFEVAQFLPYTVEGFGEDKDSEEDMTISFAPIISTTTSNCERQTDTGIPSRALFLDVDVTYEANKNTVESLYDATTNEIIFSNDELFKVEEVTKYDCGFMMGVLRTTPNESLADSYTEIRQNADGFGNAEWVRTSSVNELTSDSVTLDGAVYDYNGPDEGIGTDIEQLISLKIWAGKQNLENTDYIDPVTGQTMPGYANNPTGPLPNRGLATQFYSEYFHFMRNPKSIEVVSEMEIAELPNIQFDKYYLVNGFRCFIDKVSFTASQNGISEVTMEVFCI